jgi:hypothetical protein
VSGIHYPLELSIPDKVYHIGGNAALMGLRFAASGANVLLGGAIGPEALQLIRQNHLPDSGNMTFAVSEVRIVANRP